MKTQDQVIDQLKDKGWICDAFYLPDDGCNLFYEPHDDEAYAVLHRHIYGRTDYCCVMPDGEIVKGDRP